MNKFVVIGVAAIFVVVLSSVAFLLRPPEGEFFVVEVVGERFVLWITDAEAIRLAHENLEGHNRMHPSGELARGDGGFNHPWSWHLKPETVRMVEVSIELCDGRPSFVERDVEYWLGTVGRYCPWAGRIVALGLDADTLPAAKVSLTLDKSNYSRGDAMTITVGNPSTRTVVFPNAAYGLSFEVQVEKVWRFYTAPPALEVVTQLVSNEEATLRYLLGQDPRAPFEPGVYRALVSGGVEGTKLRAASTQEFTVA